MTATARSIPRSARGRRGGVPLELALGVLLVGALGLLALVHGVFVRANPLEGDLAYRLLPPGTVGHWLGTDHLGRDLWGRVWAGLSWSMASAVLATLFSAAIGVTIGLVAARSPGILRTSVNHLVSTALSFPGLIVAVVVVAILGQGFWPVVLTLSVITWPVFARIVFAEAQSILQREFIRAAELAGASAIAIVVGHVLPALRPTLLVLLAFHFADMLVAESALSFLGVGAPLGAPTWGNMLADSRAYMLNAPWMLLVPAAAIVIAVIAANLCGDGIAAGSRRRARGIAM